MSTFASLSIKPLSTAPDGLSSGNNLSSSSSPILTPTGSGLGTLQKSEPILPRFGTPTGSGLVSPRLSPRLDSFSSPSKSFSRSPDKSTFDPSRLSIEIAKPLDGEDPAETKQISERQVKWDKEAAAVDAKQVETFQMQWTLIREQISTFSRELAIIRTELKGLSVLNSKVSDLELKSRQQSEQLDDLVDEPRLRKEADATLEEELRQIFKGVTDALTMEEKARIAGDDDLSRSLSSAKQIFEKGERERALGFEEIYSRLQALVNALDEERAARETSDAGLRTGVANNRQELVTEKAERGDEEAGIKRAIQGIENNLASQFKDLRAALEAEVHERGAADNRLDKSEGDLRTKLEILDDKRARLAEDWSRSFLELQSGLEQEVRMRADEDSKLASALTQLNNLEDVERKERERGLTDLADKLRTLSDAVGFEAKDRALGDEDLKKELISMRNVLENETKQRIAGNKEVAEAVRGETGKQVARMENDRASMVSMMQKVTLDITSLKDNLEKETLDRKSNDEQLSRIEGRLRSELTAETTARKEGDSSLAFDLREGLRQLSDALGQEAKARLAGDDDSGKGTVQLKQLVDKEAKERELAYNDLTARLKDFLAGLEQERADRDRADMVLRDQIKTCHQDVISERNQRSEEDGALKRAMQNFESVLGQQSKDMRAALDSEALERNSTDRKLEAACEELNKVLGMEAQNRNRVTEDLDKSLRSLKTELEQEARQRVAGDDAAHQAIKSEAAARAAGDQASDKSLNDAMLKVEQLLENIQDALRKEANDRMASDDQLRLATDKNRAEIELEARSREDVVMRLAGELQDALRRFGDSLATENRERLAMVEQLGDGTRGLKQLIEKEGRDRNVADEDLAKNIQALISAFEQEKVDRELGDSGVRTQLGSTWQDLEREKAERLDNQTALRDGLRELESQIRPHLQDLGQVLESERNERGNINRKLEASINDLRGNLESEVACRVMVHDEAQEGLRSLRALVDQEAKVRAGDDEALRDAIKVEISERIAGDDSCQSRLNGLSLKVESGQDDFRNTLKGEFAFMSTKLADLRFADVKV